MAAEVLPSIASFLSNFPWGVNNHLTLMQLASQVKEGILLAPILPDLRIYQVSKSTSGSPLYALFEPSTNSWLNSYVAGKFSSVNEPHFVTLNFLCTTLTHPRPAYHLEPCLGTRLPEHYQRLAMHAERDPFLPPPGEEVPTPEPAPPTQHEPTAHEPIPSKIASDPDAPPITPEIRDAIRKAITPEREGEPTMDQLVALGQLLMKETGQILRNRNQAYSFGQDIFGNLRIVENLPPPPKLLIEHGIIIRTFDKMARLWSLSSGASELDEKFEETIRDAMGYLTWLALARRQRSKS